MKLILGFPRPDDKEADNPGRWLLAALQLFAVVLALVTLLVVYLPDVPETAPNAQDDQRQSP